MDRGAWWATVHGVAESRTDLSTKQQQQQHVVICYSSKGDKGTLSLLHIFAQCSLRLCLPPVLPFLHPSLPFPLISPPFLSSPLLFPPFTPPPVTKTTYSHSLNFKQ